MNAYPASFTFRPDPVTGTSPFSGFLGAYNQVAPPAAGEVYNQYNYYHQTPGTFAAGAASAVYPAANYWSGEYSTQYYGYPHGTDYYSAAGDASQVPHKTKIPLKPFFG